MTPAAILKQALSDGVKITLSDSGTLKATGKQDAVDRWLPTIRAHKAVIVGAIQQGMGATAANDATQPATSCRTCRHLKRPGLSAGYCGERDDLPPAYGPGHPLRRLPDDQGKSCTAWELST